MHFAATLIRREVLVVKSNTSLGWYSYKGRQFGCFKRLDIQMRTKIIYFIQTSKTPPEIYLLFIDVLEFKRSKNFREDLLQLKNIRKSGLCIKYIQRGNQKKIFNYQSTVIVLQLFSKPIVFQMRNTDLFTKYIIRPLLNCRSEIQSEINFQISEILITSSSFTSIGFGLLAQWTLQTVVRDGLHREFLLCNLPASCISAES